MKRGRRTSRSKLRELREARANDTSDDEDARSSQSLDDQRRPRGNAASTSASDDLTKVSRSLQRGQSTLEETEENGSSEVTRKKTSRSTSNRRTNSERRERSNNVAREADAARRRRRSRRAERRRQSLRSSGINEGNREEIVSRSSDRHVDADDSKRRRSHEGDGELPITEILKKSQENARTKYEEPVPLPQLTTDTIYVQGRNGFSAVKISGSSRGLKGERHEAVGRFAGREERILEDGNDENRPPIRVACAAQKLCKRTGLVYQGILGGMALMHFTVIQVFFNASVEFIVDYSLLSEIYTNVFSFLIVLCVVSVFDKFDVARFDVDHLREIYTDHARSVMVIPLYVATFCLHQAASKTDDQLALAHYHHSLNESIRHNMTNADELLLELNIWQRITVSKDILAILAWLFVSLGSRDDMLLSHLESMEQYANNVGG